MTDKLVAALRSAWAYGLVFKNWLKSWTFSVNGFQGVVAAVMLSVLLTAAYWNGRLSHREVGRMLGFAMPAADTVPVPPAPADLVYWQNRTADAEAKASQSDGAVMVCQNKVAQYEALSVTAPEPAACKPETKVVYRCPKVPTLLEDWGIVQ